ncbi:MAG: hypothetical protein ACLQA5_23150 [Solirubrobacteraceae bacterium]
MDRHTGTQVPRRDSCGASRLDQIHLKRYALVDQGLGKHEGDLRALKPSREVSRS